MWLGEKQEAKKGEFWRMATKNSRSPARKQAEAINENPVFTEEQYDLLAKIVASARNGTATALDPPSSPKKIMRSMNVTNQN